MSHKLSPLAEKILAYGLALLVGGGIALIYFGVNGAFASDLAHLDLLNKLSNGFFLAGAILAGIGLLVFVSNEGAFNFLNYAAQKLLSRFIHSMKAATMSYSDFTLAQNNKKAPFGFLLWPGLLYVLIAFILAMVFLAERGS
jgi:hypothetical protein